MYEITLHVVEYDPIWKSMPDPNNPNKEIYVSVDRDLTFHGERKFSLPAQLGILRGYLRHADASDKKNFEGYAQDNNLQRLVHSICRNNDGHEKFISRKELDSLVKKLTPL